MRMREAVCTIAVFIIVISIQSQCEAGIANTSNGPRRSRSGSCVHGMGPGFVGRVRGLSCGFGAVHECRGRAPLGSGVKHSYRHRRFVHLVGDLSVLAMQNFKSLNPHKLVLVI